MRSSGKQAGATLLEALAFLGIAAIVIVGAIAMFRVAQGSAQANDLLGQLSGIRSGVKTLMASQTTFNTTNGTGAAGGAGLNLTLINAKAVPDTLSIGGVYPNLTINNGWGGRVNVDGSATDFFVQYTNVPQEVCVKAAPQTGAAWQGLTINGNAEVATDAAVFPVATATTQCVRGANILTWRGR